MNQAGLLCNKCSVLISTIQNARFLGKCPRCSMQQDDDLDVERARCVKRIVEIDRIRTLKAAAAMDKTPTAHPCRCSLKFDSYIALQQHLAENDGPSHGDVKFAASGGAFGVAKNLRAPKATKSPAAPDFSGLF